MDDTDLFAHLISVAKDGRIPKRIELLLSLTHEGVQPCLHIRKFISNMVEQHLIQGLGEVLRAIPMCNISIRVMVSEKIAFGIEGVLQAFFRVDVLLAAVDDADETEL